VSTEPTPSSKPVTGGGPEGAPTQPLPVVAAGAAPEQQTAEQRCAQCASPLAADQRYCLNCGAPRSYLSGTLLSGSESASGPSPFGGASASEPPPPGRQRQVTAIGIVPVLLAVLALLAAMGVGVLIGHLAAPSGSTKADATPTVIQEPTASSTGAAGAAGAGSSAPTTTGDTSRTGAAKSFRAPRATRPAPPAGYVRSAVPAGTGESIEHPAPPTVIKRAHEACSASGKSCEEASKELPDVVETGK
jgi:hypothetical protein